VIERAELVSGRLCNGLYSSERDTAWESDVETERGV
jgi:hypothetical protein